VRDPHPERTRDGSETRLGRIGALPQSHAPDSEVRPESDDLGELVDVERELLVAATVDAVEQVEERVAVALSARTWSA
jgi:hypothetical protein